MKIITYLSILLIGLVSCISSPDTKNESSSVSSRVVFYNVENLFDTIDHIHYDDESFLPNSPKQWDSKKYQEKLDRITEVFYGLSNEGKLPGIIGLTEVENRDVIEDLINQKKLSETKYGIIHEDSKDERGIDVALIYDKDRFKSKKHEVLSVEFKDYPLDRTRDILFCHLSSKKGEDLFVFVNHWPSRREGKEISEPKRIAAAQVLKAKITELNKEYENPKIIIGGDFNDEPGNNSIKNVLIGAIGLENAMSGEANELVNLATLPYEEGKGTFFYWKDSDWNMLDQLIVSNSLLESNNGIQCISESMQIYKPDFLLYKDKSGNNLPSKSYGGNRYYGGYSDHFAVYMDISN